MSIARHQPITMINFNCIAIALLDPDESDSPGGCRIDWRTDWAFEIKPRMERRAAGERIGAIAKA